MRVGGVAAYSTLGWFADPVLNTFLDYADADLAAPDLPRARAPGRLRQDDSAFNESFATAVEVEGVRRWLRAGAGAKRWQPSSAAGSAGAT